MFVWDYVIAITDLKNAFQELDVRVSVLEGKTPNVSFLKLLLYTYIMHLLLK